MKPLPIFVAFVLIDCLYGCSQSPPALSNNQVNAEVTSQQKFKDQLKGMTPEQVAQQFKNDPQRARALLMPPGMGNPALRINQRPSDQK